EMERVVSGRDLRRAGARRKLADSRRRRHRPAKRAQPHRRNLSHHALCADARSVLSLHADEPGMSAASGCSPRSLFASHLSASACSNFRAPSSRREAANPNQKLIMAKGNNAHRKETKKPKKEKPKPQPGRRA